MRYKVYFFREDGTDSPFGPSKITADTLVDAQRVAAQTLRECQAIGLLTGWSIKTVIESH